MKVMLDNLGPMLGLCWDIWTMLGLCSTQMQGFLASELEKKTHWDLCCSHVGEFRDHVGPMLDNVGLC